MTKFEDIKEKYSGILLACKNINLLYNEPQPFLLQLIHFHQNHKDFTNEQWDEVGQWVKNGNKRLGFYIINDSSVSIDYIKKLFEQKVFSYEQKFEILSRKDADKPFCNKVYNSITKNRMHVCCVTSAKEEKLNQHTMDIVLKNAKPARVFTTLKNRSIGMKEYSLSHSANTELIERYLKLMEDSVNTSNPVVNEIDTALIINNCNIPDSLRERAEQLGYDPQYIKTPHQKLFDELYESAAETATNETMDKASSGYATKFLKGLILQHQLTSSQELDLAMRLIDMERTKSNIPGELLENLIFETKNEDVFDLYMSTAYDRRNRWEEILYMAKGMTYNNVDTMMIVLFEDMASGKKKTLNDWQYDFIMRNIQGRRMHENVYEALKPFTDEGTFEMADTAPMGISQIQNVLKIVASEPNTPASFDEKLLNVHQNSISTYVYAKQALQKAEIPYCKENGHNYLGAFEWTLNAGVSMTFLNPKEKLEMKESYPIIIKALEGALKKIKEIPYYRAKENVFGIINTDIDNMLYMTRRAYDAVKERASQPLSLHSEFLVDVDENGKNVEYFIEHIDEFNDKYNNIIEAIKDKDNRECDISK